jgi:hypothetical protein
MRNKNDLQGVRSIVGQVCLRIDRLVRVHKTIIIGIVTALLIIGFAMNSTYSIGSCQHQSSIKIINEASKRDYEPTSINTTDNSPFKDYVTSMSKYMFKKIDEIGQCKGDLNSDPQVELVFVYRPLISSGITPFDFKWTQSSDTRNLNSPWVKLSISRSPKLIVRAAFIWNQQQFFFDQAVLSGAPALPTKPLLPISGDIFHQYINKSVMHATSPISKSSAEADISTRPADLKWLPSNLFFRSGDFNSSVSHIKTMDRFISRRVAQYIDLTKALLNRRFSSLQTDQYYASILDLKDEIDIDKYRI